MKIRIKKILFFIESMFIFILAPIVISYVIYYHRMKIEEEKEMQIKESKNSSLETIELLLFLILIILSFIGLFPFIDFTKHLPYN